MWIFRISVHTSRVERNVVRWMWAKVNARHRSIGSNVPQLHIAVGIAGGHSVSLERGKERQRYLVRHNNVILKFYMDLIILTPLLSLSPSLCSLSLSLSLLSLPPPLLLSSHSLTPSLSLSISLYLSLPPYPLSFSPLTLTPSSHSLTPHISLCLSISLSVSLHSLTLSLLSLPLSSHSLSPVSSHSLSLPISVYLSLFPSLLTHSLSQPPSFISIPLSLSFPLSLTHTHTQAHHTKLSLSE